MIWEYHHPLVIFVVFVGTLIMICLGHPFFCIASGVWLLFMIKDCELSVRRFFLTLSGFSLLLSLMNPLISHNGKTVLLFVGDKAYTWEAMLYGLKTGVVITLAIYWSFCFQKIMTMSRILCILSPFPKLSLLFTMTVRTVPLAGRLSSEMEQAGRLWQENPKNPVSLSRMSHKLHQTDMLMGYMLENGIQTADSMSMRCYGREKQSRMYRYHFHRHDLTWLLGELFCFGLVFFFYFTGGLSVSFYPGLSVKINGYLILSTGLYSLCLFSFLVFNQFLKGKKQS